MANRFTNGRPKMPLSIEVGMGPGDFVLDGNPAPPQKRTQPSNFWSMSNVAKRLDRPRCHLIATKVGHIVLDGDPAPHTPKGATPNFRPMSVVAKRLDG